ncbi:hypothetical protein [Catenuloplanes japonicus]|uniref:hypothetical protein n=1 Tax=Catenuloplanes japonicus TaxID=33876 RepID=UPI0005269DB1|nr:hypothetical protein [Catenuloplanes japonicus]
MASAIAVIVVVALLAVIANLKGRLWLAVVLVAVLGALASNTPGPLGQYADRGAKWVLSVPSRIGGLLD